MLSIDFLTTFMDTGRILPLHILVLFQSLFYYILHSLTLLLLDVIQSGYGLVVLNTSWIRSLYKRYLQSTLSLKDSFELLLLESDESLTPLDHSPSLPSSLSFTWVEAVRHSLALKNSVELCPDGVGGTYFIKDQDNHYIGLFKPIDEEPGAKLNPKQLLNNPLMPPGGGAIREVVAYLLDLKHSAGVPETLIVHNMLHQNFNNQDKSQITPKTGSLQKYINNLGYSDSMGSSCFFLDDVHHIGILDIRILNLDRNEENMLIVKDDRCQIRLVPIDHAYCLPESLDDDIYFQWFNWRQAKIPFNEKTLQLIQEIDIEADSILLEKLGISKKAIGFMRLASILLKRGAIEGKMTLFQIASWISPRRNEVSQFKKLVERTNELVKLRKQDKDRIFEQLVDELISSCQS